MENEIFNEEKILRAYFREELKQDFEKTTIEELIGYSKSYGYILFRAKYRYAEAMRAAQKRMGICLN